MVTNNLISRIRNWPIEKKKFFSILIAIVLTILIVVLNMYFNSIWQDETPKTNYLQENAINSMQKSFSNVLNEIQPTINHAISSSTQLLDEIKSASSSVSSSSNVVQ